MLLCLRMLQLVSLLPASLAGNVHSAAQAWCKKQSHCISPFYQSKLPSALLACLYSVICSKRCYTKHRHLLPGSPILDTWLCHPSALHLLPVSHWDTTGGAESFVPIRMLIVLSNGICSEPEKTRGLSKKLILYFKINK